MKPQSPTQQKQNRHQHGQGLLEYAMMIFLVGIAAIIAVNLFEDQLREVYRDFVGSGEFAPPDIGPIGGEFTPRPATSTPIPSDPEITQFSTNRGTQILATTADLPLTIQFDVLATDADNDITTYAVEIENDAGGFDSYSWTQADNETGNSASHTFTSLGMYQADLRVIDSRGEEDTLSLNITVDTVLPDTPPIILAVNATSLLDTSPTSLSIVAGETISFTSNVQFDSAADEVGASYVWSLDDGDDDTPPARSGASVRHTYSVAGTYEVRLQVTESDYHAVDNPDVTVRSDVIQITVLAPTPTPTSTPTPTNTPDCTIPIGAIPGTIEMENFNCGGQGVAYNDTSPDSNSYGTVRTDEGVDIRDKNSILAVFADTNEWLEYEVNVASIGIYDFTINYASVGAKNIRLYVDGTIIGTERLESSGSFDTFASHTISSIPLGSGTRIVRVEFLNNNAFFNSMEWTVSSSATIVAINSCTTTGIEAENANISGDFVVASDSNASGGQYVHVPNGSGGGSGPSSDSVTFAVDLSAAAAGTYQLRGYAYAASGNDNSFFVDIDGSPSAGYLWDTNQNTNYDSELIGDRNGDDPITISLSEGTRSIRISNREDGTRLDRLELICTGSLAPTATNTPTATPTNTPTSTPTPSQTPTPGASPTPASNEILFVVADSSSLNTGDIAVRAVLTGRGYSVTTISDETVAATDANGKALVVISSTVGSSNVGDKLRDVTVPVLLWEQALYDNMRMSSNGETNGDETDIVIRGPNHPLANGLSDTVTVLSGSDTFSYATGLASSAIVIATTTDSSQYIIFGYETGAVMQSSFVAPNRRVGFYLEDDTAENWNSDGQSLFVAAVDWAINGGPASSYTVQAEDFSDRSLSVGIRTFNSGFTGTSYLDYGGDGSYAEWEIGNAKPGTYTLTFRYAVGNSGTRYGDLRVNSDPVESVEFVSTGSWSSWSTVTIDVTLEAGVNTIRLTADGQGPNIDVFTYE